MVWDPWPGVQKGGPGQDPPRDPKRHAESPREPAWTGSQGSQGGSNMALLALGGPFGQGGSQDPKCRQPAPMGWLGGSLGPIYGPGRVPGTQIWPYP